MNDKRPPLVLSAVSFETAELKKLRPSWIYAEFGIGAITAARNIGALRSLLQERRVIYLGTCGIFGEFREIELFTAVHCHWLPPCIRAELAWKIDGVDERISIPNALKSPLSGKLSSAEVLCSTTISKSPEFLDNSKVSTKNALVENLELYSILPELLESCQTLDVLLATTNSIGAKARLEWKANFKTAAKVTANFIHKNFEASQ